LKFKLSDLIIAGYYLNFLTYNLIQTKLNLKTPTAMKLVYLLLLITHIFITWLVFKEVVEPYMVREISCVINNGLYRMSIFIMISFCIMYVGISSIGMIS